jgi:hypothetical protein
MNIKQLKKEIGINNLCIDDARNAVFLLKRLIAQELDRLSELEDVKRKLFSQLCNYEDNPQ